MGLAEFGIPGTNTVALTAYIRRDNATDQFTDYPLPTPVGITNNIYAYAQHGSNGNGTLLDPYDRLGVGGVETHAAAGDEVQLWGDFPWGDRFLTNGHGTITNHLWIRGNPSEAMPTIQGSTNISPLNWNVSAYQYQWAEDIEFQGAKISGQSNTIGAVLDNAHHCFFVDIIIRGTTAGSIRLFGNGNNNWFDGFECHDAGSIASNGGDGVYISGSALSDTCEDNTFVRGHMHLCGHSGMDHGAQTGGAGQGYQVYRTTVAYVSVDNPWSAGILFHDNWNDCMVEHAVIQNCGVSDTSPHSTGSKIAFHIYSHRQTMRHIRCRNLWREGGKAQAGSHPGGWQGQHGHVYHVTMDRSGLEGWSILGFTGGVEAAFSKDHMIENCMFLNANSNHDLKQGAGGNAVTTAFWCPTAATAFGVTATQWAAADEWNSGAAICDQYMENNVFVGLTQEILTSWTNEGANIHSKVIPNKFTAVQDPDSGVTELPISDRSSYSDEMVFFNGVEGQRKTALVDLVDERDFFNDNGTIYIYSSASPSGQTIAYGRAPSSVRFHVYGPRSGNGSVVARTLAAAEAQFVELSNNLHDISVDIAAAGDMSFTREAYTKATAGYKGANVDEWLKPDLSGGSAFQDAGKNTLGKSSIGIPEFSISTLAGTGEPSSGYSDGGADIGTWEVSV